MGNRVKNDWRFKTRSRAVLLKTQNGFTLVELVVVIAILGVLAAVTVPRVNQFLNQATEVSYDADLAIVQSAVSAWYSSLHNEQFLGGRQFPIIGRNETGQEGRIVRGEDGVENVNAVGPFNHKDDSSPLAPPIPQVPTGTPWAAPKAPTCCTWEKTALPHGRTTGMGYVRRERMFGPPLR